jgi:hypothetical protein
MGLQETNQPLGAPLVYLRDQVQRLNQGRPSADQRSIHLEAKQDDIVPEVIEATILPTPVSP